MYVYKYTYVDIIKYKMHVCMNLCTAFFVIVRPCNKSLSHAMNVSMYKKRYGMYVCVARVWAIMDRNV